VLEVLELQRQNITTHLPTKFSQPANLTTYTIFYRIVSYRTHALSEKTLAKDKPKIRNNSVIVNDGDNVSTGNTSLITSG